MLGSSSHRGWLYAGPRFGAAFIPKLGLHLSRAHAAVWFRAGVEVAPRPCSHPVPVWAVVGFGPVPKNHGAFGVPQKTMETLTRILAQHVYRLNLADLPLQRQQQHRRRRGLKHHHAASNPGAPGATAKAETGRGDNTGDGGAGNAAAGSAAHVNGVAPPSHRASPSLADSREGSRESGVPPSPRLRTGSVGQRSCRTEGEGSS